MPDLSPSAFAIELLIDMRREITRALDAPDQERAVLLHSLRARVNKAIVQLSAQVLRGVIVPFKGKQPPVGDCQRERP